MFSICYRSRQKPCRARLPPPERGLSDERTWIICHFGHGDTPKVADYPRSISNGRKSTLDFAWEEQSSVWEAPISTYIIGANKPVSKFDTEGVLHYTKVLPRETSPQYPKPPSFISKLNKTAGHSYIDTPGTVYLEVFVDSPQGCIVLSFSFAGAAVQKTKGPADT